MDAQVRRRFWIEATYSASIAWRKCLLSDKILELVAICLLLLTILPAYVADPDNKLADLGNLPFEKLTNIHATSESRHAENIEDATASSYVLTAALTYTIR